MAYKDPEKKRAYRAAYYASHREEALTYQAAYASAHREQRSARSRGRKYGLTPEGVEAKRVEQDNACAICGAEFIRTPHIDHNHQTGEVRALLCTRCNILVGFLEHQLAPIAGAYIAQWESGV